MHTPHRSLKFAPNRYGQMPDLSALVSWCRLFRDISEIEKLSQLGVLFLLFEMGLELSLDRLKVTSFLPRITSLLGY